MCMMPNGGHLELQESAKIERKVIKTTDKKVLLAINVKRYTVRKVLFLYVKKEFKNVQ